MAIIRRGESPVSRFGRDFDPYRAMRSLLNWDPFQELTPRLWRDESAAFVPAFDVKESKDAYEFSADLPGFREQDVDINVSGNRLTISGEREAERSEESDTFFCSERSYGSFTRTFTLPDDVDTEQVKAELSDGVLNVHIPKAEERQAKRIPVSASGKSEQGKAQAGAGPKAKTESTGK